MQNSMSGGFYAYDKTKSVIACVTIADFFYIIIKHSKMFIVAREKGKGKMLKPQQLTRRRNDLERAVRGAMGRALIRTGKELGEEIGLSETQICNRMAGRSRWTLEEIWELDRVLQFTDAEKLMLIGGTK